MVDGKTIKLLLVPCVVIVQGWTVCVRAGRRYLAKNGELIVALIACLQMETEDVLTHDHTLFCLQRLSLKFVSWLSHLPCSATVFIVFL